MQTIDHNHTILKLENVSFSFVNEEVIKNVSFAVHKGDYLGIIGPNGGGKTTLLKLMLGLLKPTYGQISLFGKKITTFSDWSKLGYVRQNATIENNLPLTVIEAVSMGRYGKLGFFKMPTKVDHAKVEKALYEVNMLEYKNRRLSDLSGGQRQRVFIARALASEPEIIFLDEPTVGVDIKTQKQFYKLLRKLNRELSLTLVLVSHELDVVAHEATEIGYINRSLVYYGEPEEFLKGDYFHELIGKGGIHKYV